MTRRLNETLTGQEPGAARGFRAAAPVLVALLLCCAAVPTFGRVFARFGSTDRLSDLMESNGGRLVYQTAASVNGRDVELRVHSFGDPLRSVWPALAKASPEGVFMAPAPSTARAAIPVRGGVADVIGLDLLGNGQSLVISTLYPGDRSVPPRAEPDAEFKASIPSPPDAGHRFFARDKGTSMALAVSNSNMPARALVDYYRNALASRGWNEPLASADRAGNMLVFMKSGEVACVNISQARPGRASVITVLHKPMGVK